jgi:glycerate dehydrogenase
MKIVITDGYTLNPGDLTWDAFNRFGEVIYYDRTNVDDVSKRCGEAEIIITNKTPITADTIRAAKQLKLIAVTATGYNVVDISVATKLGVTVCNVPEYGTHSVAQHTFALILELTNNVGLHGQSVKQGDWVKCQDFSYAKTPIIELKDKVLGIVGLGKIGKQAAQIAMAFDMKVIYHGGHDSAGAVRDVTLNDLFSECDFVSLHCPLKPDNRGFVNKDLLAKMKRSAFLINTSRGQLINEEDLAAALQNGVIAGAALDVLSKEPPPANNPLLHVPNCLITPHNAWVSFEARQRILNMTFENIKVFLEGHPRNVVNGSG